MNNITELYPTAWSLVKLGVIIFLVLYNIFAVIVVKQVRVMINTLEVGFEKPVVIISFVHLAISLFVLLFSLVIL